MLTISMLGRLWRTARYRQIVRQVCEGRPEGCLSLDDRLGGPTGAAALALLRLGELNQFRLPLAAELRERVLMSQAGDGGWGTTSSGKAMLTALCVRSLGDVSRATASAMEERNGAAVRRGMDWLAGSVNRWGEDPFECGFVLLELGRNEAFRRRLPIAKLMHRGRLWQAQTREEDVRLVWSRCRLRCGTVTPARAPERALFEMELNLARA